MTVEVSKFDQTTIESTVVQLADHMPHGYAWAAKAIIGSNLQAQMHGTGKPFHMLLGRIADLAKDFDINQTTELIDDWETSVGLPEDCFGEVPDIDERRRLIRERFQKIPIVTLAQQQTMIDYLFPGQGIILTPGVEVYSFEYSFELDFIGNIADRFIIVARVPPQEPFFEMDFEVEFTGGFNADTLLCVMERMTPVNVLPLIVEDPSLAT